MSYQKLRRSYESKGTGLKVGDPAKFLLTKSSFPDQWNRVPPALKQSKTAAVFKNAYAAYCRVMAAATEDADATRRRDMGATARRGSGQSTILMSAAR